MVHRHHTCKRWRYSAVTRILFLALTLAVTACAGASTPKPAENGNLQFLSLSPETLGRSLSLSQVVIGEYNGKIHRMRFELDIKPARLAIVGLSPLGVTLFTIVQEKGELTIESVGEKTTFDPRYTLFDLYLTYWPKDALRVLLAKLKMRIDDTPDKTVRRIRGPDGELIVEIIYPPKHLENGEITIQHFDIPYRLRIATLDARSSR
jgi:hypothetical protein